jgi:ABC-type uncharacterized transport system substrate-binding protein
MRRQLGLKILFMGLFIVICVLSNFEVYAHPHVWIDPEITFVFSSERLESIKLRYTFDEMYSAMRFSQFDKNNNGDLEPNENELLGKEILKEIQEWHYFSHIKHDNQNSSLLIPRTADINMEEDERLSLTLELPYNIPVTVDYQVVALSVYDENYYYEIMNPSEGVVKVVGKHFIWTYMNPMLK